VPVLKTSSTKRIVSVELSPDQQSVAHRGQRVAVLLPGGEEAAGKVRRIAASEGSSEEAPGGESEPGVEVTVSIVGKTKAPALDGAAVSVLFTQQIRKQVLSVPLTALVAIGGERFAVIAIEGAQRRRIEVTPGLAADGYVEVEGEGLREGMRVETGE
jgi:multidrug efflux pump subunit AcrA (membrane-fusion protein)